MNDLELPAPEDIQQNANGYFICMTMDDDKTQPFLPFENIFSERVFDHTLKKSDDKSIYYIRNETGLYYDELHKDFEYQVKQSRGLSLW